MPIAKPPPTRTPTRTQRTGRLTTREYRPFTPRPIDRGPTGAAGGGGRDGWRPPSPQTDPPLPPAPLMGATTAGALAALSQLWGVLNIGNPIVIPGLPTTDGTPIPIKPGIVIRVTYLMTRTGRWCGGSPYGPNTQGFANARFGNVATVEVTFDKQFSTNLCQWNIPTVRVSGTHKIKIVSTSGSVLLNRTDNFNLDTGYLPGLEYVESGGSFRIANDDYSDYIFPTEVVPQLPRPWDPFPLPEPEPLTEPEVQPLPRRAPPLPLAPPLAPPAAPPAPGPEAPPLTRPTDFPGPRPVPLPLTPPTTTPLPPPQQLPNQDGTFSPPTTPTPQTPPSTEKYLGETIGEPGTAPPPTMQGIAQEVGKIEKKLRILGDKTAGAQSPIPDLSELISQIYNLLNGIYDGGEYSLSSPCSTDGEGNRTDLRTVSWQGGVGRFSQLSKKIDAVAMLLQDHKDLGQPTCVKELGGKPVTVWFEEVP